MRSGHTNAFLLTPVSSPVTMMSAPAAQIVGPGATVMLQIQMAASEPLTYQWLHEGMPIPGATNAMRTLSGTGMASAGQYTVMARNSVGTVASASTALSMFTMQFTNGMPHLTVAAPSGSRFRIDYSDLLGNSASWHTMTNFTTMGSMTQMSDTPPQASRARFYRAALMP
jgi:hypothetical protein